LARPSKETNKEVRGHWQRKGRTNDGLRLWVGYYVLGLIGGLLTQSPMEAISILIPGIIQSISSPQRFRLPLIFLGGVGVVLSANRFLRAFSPSGTQDLAG
jgi:hypothetical protein